MQQYSSYSSIKVYFLFNFNQEDRQRRNIPLSGSATLPAFKTGSTLELGSSGSLDSPAGKPNKSYQKHTRGASESVVDMNRGAIARKSKWFVDIVLGVPYKCEREGDVRVNLVV